MTQDLNFGQALQAAKAGYKITRKGWNGKGLSVKMFSPSENSEMSLPFLYMVYPSTPASETAPSNHIGAKVPWLASQTDLLAEDWMILDYKGVSTTSSILQTPVKYNLVEVLTELKFGRSAKDQQFLDLCISTLEQD